MAKKSKQEENKYYDVTQEEKTLLQTQADLIAQHEYQAELIKRDRYIFVRAIAKGRLGIDDDGGVNYDPETHRITILPKEELEKQEEKTEENTQE